MNKNVILFFVGLFSCQVQSNENTESPDPAVHMIQAMLYQQVASEKRALCYQAYNLAKMRIDQIVAENPDAKNLALITDVDETVLDNSPLNGQLVHNQSEYSSDIWKEWSDLGMADTIPGSVEFLNYAQNLGVEVFYVTNRKSDEEETTIKNLEMFGYPNADSEHLFLRTAESGKDARRALVTQEHEVVLLLGDNLNDFSSIFEKKGAYERGLATDDLRKEFGRNFIVFPNTMYGEWESYEVMEGRRDFSLEQKDSLRRKKILGF